MLVRRVSTCQDPVRLLAVIHQDLHQDNVLGDPSVETTGLRIGSWCSTLEVFPREKEHLVRSSRREDAQNPLTPADYMTWCLKQASSSLGSLVGMKVPYRGLTI